MPLPSTSNVSRPQALGYGALLDDLYLRLVGNPELQVNPQIETLRPEATRIDTGQNPEDFISEVGQTFSRAQFAGGEGLGFAHREGSARNRYWDSRNVDVALPDPGERHAARLERGWKSVRSGGEFPVTDGSSVWVTEQANNKVYRTDDPLANSPTFVEDVISANVAVFSMAILGDKPHVGTGSDGIYRREAADDWQLWSNVNASIIWSVKRRILAKDASGTGLYEARSGSGSVLLATLSSGKHWRDVADGGSHILATADDGYIYSFFVGGEGSELVLDAQNEIPFEEPISITAVGDIILIGTTRPAKESGGTVDEVSRLWRGRITGDGTLHELDLIREWESNSSIGVLVSDGESVYATVEEFDGGTSDGVLVWKYNLASGGLSHFFTASSGAADEGATFFGSRVFFNLGSIVRTETSFASSGYLITPAADFFTALDKSWQEVTVDAELPTGDDATDTKVEAYYATDLDAMDDPNSGLWTLAGTLTPGSTEDTFQITGVQSRFIVLMVKLYSSTDQTANPRVNSVSVTATVVAEEVSIQLPVNVSDVIELPGRKRHNLHGLGEKVYQQLRSKHGKEATLELFRPAEKIRGVVWSVSAPVHSVSSRGERTVVCNVEVRGKPTS